MTKLRLPGIVLLGLMTTFCSAAKRENTNAPPPSLRILSDALGYHPLKQYVKQQSQYIE